MRFIHLSDLHIVPPGTLLHGLDPGARLRACVAEINRFSVNPGGPEFCVVSGDLVDRGDAISYQYLHDLLGALEIPYYLMVGNHDSRAAFFEVFRQFSPDPNGFAQYTLTTKMGTFVFLDTLDEGKPSGIICELRLRWLRDQLNELAGSPVYLFTHHPPFDIFMPTLDRMRMFNADGLRKVIGPHDIRHLFFGHTHRPLSGQWHAMPFFGVPSSVHQIGSEFVNLEPMPYNHGPAAFAFVDLTEGLSVTQLHHFLPEHQHPRRLEDGSWSTPVSG